MRNALCLGVSLVIRRVVTFARLRRSPIVTRVNPILRALCPPGINVTFRCLNQKSKHSDHSGNTKDWNRQPSKLFGARSGQHIRDDSKIASPRRYSKNLSRGIVFSCKQSQTFEKHETTKHQNEDHRSHGKHNIMRLCRTYGRTHDPATFDIDLGRSLAD